MDRKRSRYNGLPGALWSLVNGHLTRGGEAEGMKKFVADKNLPTGTFGMAALSGGLYVFGSQAAPAMPSGVTYQRLQHPDGTTAMSGVRRVQAFNGKLYVIAEFANGDLRHYYDGSEVSQWDDGGTKPTGYGTTLLTFKGKLYSSVSTLVYFCATDVATVWDSADGTNIGAGFINASSQDDSAQDVTALSIYQGQLSIFARNSIQTWTVEPDPAQNVYLTTIQNTGTRAPKSVIAFGNTDTFYLADVGIRTLRARQTSDAAFVADIGIAIDKVVKDYLATLTDDQIEDAVAVLEPGEDRLWLAVGERIFVFSYFPGGKISAWSYYDVGMQITDFARIEDKLYARAGDTIYLYGGSAGDTYPDDGESEMVVELPYLDAKTPATIKNWEGYDLAGEGAWRVKLLPDPADDTAEIDGGFATGITYARGRQRAAFKSTHCGVKLTCSSAGRRLLANAAFHYEDPNEAG